MKKKKAEKKRTLADMKAELAQAQAELLKVLEARKAHQDANKVYYFKPYGWMNRTNALIRDNNIVVAPLPNKIGKTAYNCCLIDSWCRGYEPWSIVTEDYPGAVRDKVFGEVKYFKPSSLGIKPPVKIRFSGEDWFKHFGETVLPEMRKWLPSHDYDTKKNSMGFDYKWIHRKTQSTIELITYKQDISGAESWMGHAWIADEPPPEEMYTGMSRGVFLSNGKVYLPTTPLKEAWILDRLILSGRRDIGIIDDLTILANDDLYIHDTKLLEELRLSKEQIKQFFDLLIFKDKEKRIFVEDEGKGAERFLEEIIPMDLYEKIRDLSLLRLVKDVPKDQASTRFGGQFKSLVGRVIKEFDREKHWIAPFDIPTDWPVVAMIDFHLNKPHAISYHTVNRQDVKFICGEVYENMSTEEVADTIIRDKSRHAWRLEEVQIDPLSKGDTAYMANRYGSDLQDSFSIIEGRLKRHGIKLNVGSKDKTSGVNNINAQLKGVNGMPTYFVFNTCQRHYLELMRWVYDANGKPMKGNKDDYDDMMENWYRATLSGLRYREKKNVSYAPAHEYTGPNAWMAM